MYNDSFNFDKYQRNRINLFDLEEEIDFFGKQGHLLVKDEDEYYIVHICIYESYNNRNKIDPSNN